MYQVTHGFEGESQTGYYLFEAGNGMQVRLSGREAALLGLLLSGRKLPEDVHPLGVFGLPHEKRESVAPGKV
jgi:hypothetical protein